MSFSPIPSIAALSFNIPPIQSVTIPNQNLFNTGGFNQRNKIGGGQHCNNKRKGSRGHPSRGCTSFATHMASLGHRQGQQQPQFPRAAGCPTWSFTNVTIIGRFVSPVGLMWWMATPKSLAPSNRQIIKQGTCKQMHSSSLRLGMTHAWWICISQSCQAIGTTDCVGQRSCC